MVLPTIESAHPAPPGPGAAIVDATEQRDGHRRYGNVENASADYLLRKGDIKKRYCYVYVYK